jgi:hypothetical protein
MLIAGFWHGAGWTFVFWGFLMAFFMIFGFYTKKIRSRLFKRAGLKFNSGIKTVIQVSVNFVLLTFAWIFFRADSFSNALITIKKIISIPFGELSRTTPPDVHGSPVFSNEMIFTIILVLIYFTIEFLQEYLQNKNREINKSINVMPAVLRFAFYVIAVCFVLFAGYFSIIQFIYAQF